MSFAALIVSLEASDDALTLDLPESWTQGRTAFGGLTAAMCVEAARRAHPGLPPLRSAQLAFAGPASGLLSVRTTLIRQGRSAAVVEAAVDGEAGPATRALLTYGAARDSRVAHQLDTMPVIAAPDACPDFFSRPGSGPVFASNFETRMASGSRPMSGGEPRFALWVRHRDATAVDPETALIALADAPPPAALAAFSAPGPISTMTWSIDITALAAPGDWHLIVSRSDRAADGYSSQGTTIWSTDGRMIAQARQVVALFV